MYDTVNKIQTYLGINLTCFDNNHNCKTVQLIQNTDEKLMIIITH